MQTSKLTKKLGKLLKESQSLKNITVYSNTYELPGGKIQIDWYLTHKSAKSALENMKKKYKMKFTEECINSIDTYQDSFQHQLAMQNDNEDIKNNRKKSEENRRLFFKKQ